MKEFRPLRIALFSNAVFSMVSGALMAFLPKLILGWLGLQTSPIISIIIGAGLIIFSADLFRQATRFRLLTWQALYASGADLTWVLATVVLLALFPTTLSYTGNLLVSVIAMLVFGFGSWQFWGINKAHKTLTGNYRHCISIRTHAPPQAMWEVIRRLEDIKLYAPSLQDSFTKGEHLSVGTVRTCTNHAGKRWSEECIAFEEGRIFTLRFLAEAPDFPFPVHHMTGGWEIVAEGEGTLVNIWWELMPKPRALAGITTPLFAFQIDRDMPLVVENMARAALEKQGDAASPKRLITTPFARLC